MPVPKPQGNESQAEFVSRCHSTLANEFTDQKQRHAVCMTSWKDNKKSVSKGRNVMLDVKKALNDVNRIITSMEREKLYKSFIKEIPTHTLNLFSYSGQMKFKELYLDNRIAGVAKSDALNITTSLITRAYRGNKVELLKGIEKALVRVKDRIEKGEFLGDEESIELFPPKDSITAIDDDGEDNIEKARDYKEGDKKMIFGKPFEMHGGKWTPASGGGKKEEEPKGEGKKEKPAEEGAEGGKGSPSLSNMTRSLQVDAGLRPQETGELGAGNVLDLAYEREQDHNGGAKEVLDAQRKAFDELSTSTESGKRASSDAVRQRTKEILESGAGGIPDIKSALTEKGIPEEHHEAVQSLLQSEGLTHVDIDSVDDRGHYGQGVVVSAGGGEYAIMSDDEAETAARESVQSLIDEMGTEGFSDWVVQDNIDTEKMGRDLSFDSQSEFDNAYDDPSMVLDEEPEGENGDWSEEQRQKAGDEAESSFRDQVTSDPMGYMSDRMGEEEAKKWAIEKGYIDENGIIDDVIRHDGRGHVLSGYDGEEREHGGKFIYRVN